MNKFYKNYKVKLYFCSQVSRSYNFDSQVLIGRFWSLKFKLCNFDSTYYDCVILAIQVSQLLQLGPFYHYVIFNTKNLRGTHKTDLKLSCVT